MYFLHFLGSKKGLVENGVIANNQSQRKKVFEGEEFVMLESGIIKSFKYYLNQQYVIRSSFT